MAQGLQVWDATGRLIVDTSVSVLKEFIAVTAVDNSTAVVQVPVNVPPNTTIVTGSLLVEGNGTAPMSRWNAVDSRLEYQWNQATGNREARVNILLY